jgi:hypothetical protein
VRDGALEVVQQFADEHDLGPRASVEEAEFWLPIVAE